jgi:putative oxidoreductase
MKLGRLLLRVTVGGLFVGHGTQKLLGWFEGQGPERTGKTFEQAGLAPGRKQAMLAGTAETGGGAFLAAGYSTPLASALLSGVMLTAIRRVHWQRGPWATNGGYEYPLVLLAVLFGLAEAGPGSVSVDAARGRVRCGLRWALAELGAAWIGSQLAIVAGRRLAARAEQRQRSPESPQWRDTREQPHVRVA